MNGLPYYKAYPRDFMDGTAGMDFEVKGAYRLLLDLIYMHGGRLVDEPRFIAGHLGCSVKKWNGLRAAIIATGKISVSDGYLGNLRADKELDSLKSFSDKQRENGSKPKKIKGIAEATAYPKSNHTDTDTDTEEEKSSVAKATDEIAAKSADPVDPIKAVFDAGVRVLGKAGLPEPKARAFLGKLRKDHPGQDGQILTAIMDCGRAGAVDPIPWITAVLSKPKTPTVADIMAKIAAEGRPQ